MQEHGCHMVRQIQFLQLYDYTYSYIQPGSLTQKYEAFRPLYFTWQDSSAGAMVGMTNK